jgi:hypothetical protein
MTYRILALLTLFTACTPQLVWWHPQQGNTLLDKDLYQCEGDAMMYLQQPYGAFGPGAMPSSAAAHIRTQQCMRARGYELVRPQDAHFGAQYSTPDLPSSPLPTQPDK